MSDDQITAAGQVEAVDNEASPSPALTNAAQVLKLLARSRGATMADLTSVTGWQNHTARSHLTRLRKAGHVLERLERKSGPAAYHLVRESAAAPTTALGDA